MKIKLALFLLVFSGRQSILSMNPQESQKIGLTLGLAGIGGYISTFLYREMKYSYRLHYNAESPQEKYPSEQARIKYSAIKQMEEQRPPKGKIESLNRIQNFFLFLMLSGGILWSGGLWTSIRKKNQ